MRDLDIDVLADSTDHGTQLPESPALSEVSSIVASWDVINGDIRRLEETLATKKQQKSLIEKDLLPSAMAEAGVTSFVAKSGRSVKIDTIINGNIPAPSTIEKARGGERDDLIRRREECLSIIRQKWPGLLKTELVVSLGKDQTELASRIAELIRTQFELDPSIDETVHPATLNAHFKELKDDGRLEEIPVVPFALYIGPIAKIK